MLSQAHSIYQKRRFREACRSSFCSSHENILLCISTIIFDFPPNLSRIYAALSSIYQRQTRLRHFHFSKIFYLILIQVQGNKGIWIYLTGHGNETVKFYFLDPLSFWTRTCKWIQKVFYRKKRKTKQNQNVPFCRDDIGSGCHLAVQKDFPSRQLSLFVFFFFIFFYSKKETHR